MELSLIRVSYIRKSDPKFVTDTLRITTGTSKPNFTRPSIKTWKKLLRTAGGVPHSPMRAVEYRFYLWGVPSWVAVHFVRHHVGVQPYVKSQRDDRQPKGEWVDDKLYIDYGKVTRGQKPQSTPVDVILDINVNSLLDMSKARLCKQAAEETRDWMKAIRDILKTGDKYDQAVAQYMKAPCQWYGKCFEFKTCGKKYV